ncbi:MAG: hypothetical protein IH849_09270 [Acidobacteria bacterium]|nr:hypothetical protein [Acidobacteriota bacterium]
MKRHLIHLALALSLLFNVFFVVGFGFGDLLDAEQSDAAVVVERHRRPVRNRHAARESLRRGMRHPQLSRRRPDLPTVEVESRLVGAIVVSIGDERQTILILVQDQALVVTLAVDHRCAGARRRVVGVDPVGFRLLFARDRVHHHPAVVGELVAQHRRSVPLTAVGERADGERGAVILVLLVVLVRLGLLFLRFRLRGGLGGRLLWCRRRFLMQVGDVATGVLRNAEAPDALDFDHVAIGKVHDAESVLRHVFGLRLLLARRLGFLFGRGDGEHEIGRIRAETSPAAAPMPIFGAGLDVADDELAITVLRNRRVRHPLPVRRDSLPLDPLPGVVVVVGQRPLFRLHLGADRHGRKRDRRHEDHQYDERPALNRVLKNSRGYRYGRMGVVGHMPRLSSATMHHASPSSSFLASAPQDPCAVPPGVFQHPAKHRAS